MRAPRVVATAHPGGSSQLPLYPVSVRERVGVHTAASGVQWPGGGPCAARRLSQPCTTGRKRPGGGGFVGGPAGRRRGFAAPSWPHSSPAWGPGAKCGPGSPHPPRYAQKNPHCGGQRAARPLAGGAARPVAPLGGFCARGPVRRHPLPPCLLVVVVGGSGSLPRRRGPLPRKQGAGGVRPLPALPRPLAFAPARFLSPAPCFLVACPGLAPLRRWLVVVGSRSRRGRAQGAPAARRGGRHLYRR